DITIAGAVVIGQRIRRKGKMLAVAVGTLCLVGGLHGGMLMLQTHHRELAARPIRLFNAITARDADSMSALLEQDPSLALGQFHGFALLYNAVELGDAEGVQLLLKAGALPDQGKSSVHAPLLKAAQGSPGIVQLLLDAGANTHIVDQDGRTALHVAAQDDRSRQALALLLKAGLDIDVRDVGG